MKGVSHRLRLRHQSSPRGESVQDVLVWAHELQLMKMFTRRHFQLKLHFTSVCPPHPRTAAGLFHILRSPSSSFRAQTAVQHFCPQRCTVSDITLCLSVFVRLYSLQLWPVVLSWGCTLACRTRTSWGSSTWSAWWPSLRASSAPTVRRSIPVESETKATTHSCLLLMNIWRRSLSETQIRVNLVFYVSGDEIGMLEDMEVGISDLQKVVFHITEAKADDLSDLQPLVCGRRWESISVVFVFRPCMFSYFIYYPVLFKIIVLVCTMQRKSESRLDYFMARRFRLVWKFWFLWL